MKTRENCPYSKYYKGLRTPTCGCEECMRKWVLRQKIKGVDNADCRKNEKN